LIVNAARRERLLASDIVVEFIRQGKRA